MTIFTFANNINTTLAGAVSPSATTITLASTHNLPTSIPSGTVLVITLNDAATLGNYEILYVTAITGATLTVQRAQEGTAALAWLVGDYAFSGDTAGQMASFLNASQFPSSLGANGYKKYPDPNSPTGYFIEQWGTVTLGPGSSQSITLPIAFPNAFINCTVSYGSVPTAGQTCGGAPGTLSTILIGNASGGTNGIFYTARGY